MSQPQRAKSCDKPARETYSEVLLLLLIFGTSGMVHWTEAVKPFQSIITGRMEIKETKPKARKKS